jgi:hypothetical protein
VFLSIDFSTFLSVSVFLFLSLPDIHSHICDDYEKCLCPSMILAATHLSISLFLFSPLWIYWFMQCHWHLRNTLLIAFPRQGCIKILNTNSKSNTLSTLNARTHNREASHTPIYEDAEEDNWTHINNITKNYIQIKDRVLESKKHALRCHNPWLSSNRL